MNNNWICTDDDSMQYIKKTGDGQYRIIDTIWYDVCGEKKAVNTVDESDNYVVVEGTVDINELTLKEIKSAVKPFYGTLEQLGEFEHNLDAVSQIIAECYFESGICPYDKISDIMSWADAEKYINSIINRRYENDN